jgi:hypothetical protein
MVTTSIGILREDRVRDRLAFETESGREHDPARYFGSGREEPPK